MKQIASNYTYSPTTNVVTLTGVNIDQDQLLLVVAPQVGRTMYNFASGVTGAVSAGADTRLTLNASTVGLTTTSPLVIFYDDQASTQTIAGTVTANLAQGLIDESGDVGSLAPRLVVGVYDVDGTQLGANRPFPISGTVTANGIQMQVEDALFANDQLANNLNQYLTLQNNVPISGTVTANLPNSSLNPLGVSIWNDNNQLMGGDVPMAVGGVVTIAGATEFRFLQVSTQGSASVFGTVTVGNSITIGSLPAISGTVTAAAPNGSLTTRFGTPTTANTAFATAAVTKSDRKYLLIQNVTTGSNVITVGIGFTPTTTQGIQLTAGAGITFESSYIPTGAVYVLSSVTASNFTILEG